MLATFGHLFGADKFRQIFDFDFCGKVRQAHTHSQVRMLHIQNGQPFQEQFTVYHAVFQAFAKPIAVKFGEFFKIFENLCLVAGAGG